MKKYFIIFFIILILLFSACTSNTVQGGIVIHGEANGPADLSESYPGETIVYVTESGSKYHREDCSYLSSSSIPISLEQAIMEGKEPCSRCNPPAAD